MSIKRLHDAYSKKQVVITKMLIGKGRHVKEYEQISETINRLLKDMPAKRISMLSFRRKSPPLRVPIRLGTTKFANFYSELKKIARANTKFIMDMSLIQKTFDDLSRNRCTLKEIETRVNSLAKSVGFKGGALELEDYIYKPFDESLSVYNVGEGLKATFDNMIDVLIRDSQISSHENDYVNKYVELDYDDVKELYSITANLVTNIRSIKVTPLPTLPTESTPNDLRHLYKEPQLRKYDITKAKQLHDVMQEKVNHVKQLIEQRRPRTEIEPLTKETAHLKDELDKMLAATSNEAIGYWHDVFEYASQKLSLELAYKDDVAALSKGLQSEVEYTVNEMIGRVQSIAKCSADIMVLCALASIVINNNYEEELPFAKDVAKEINNFFSRCCYRREDYFAMLTAVFKLSNTHFSIREHLAGIGFPNGKIPSDIARWSKKRVFKATMLWILYRALL